MVDRMKLAVDLRVVTEFAGITVGVGSGEVPANISACVGCISRFDERIALIVYEVARTARYAVVAGAVFLAVVAMELIAFLWREIDRPATTSENVVVSLSSFSV